MPTPDESLLHTFDPSIDVDGPIYDLPVGQTDSAELAVGLWQAHAKKLHEEVEGLRAAETSTRREEAARCALICLERAAGHKRTLDAGAGVQLQLEWAIREAEKCAANIKMGVQPDGEPATALAEVHATCLAERDHLRMERDRAEQAYANLHSSHAALTVARDENSTRIVKLRELKFAIEAIVRELKARMADRGGELAEAYVDAIVLLEKALT